MTTQLKNKLEELIDQLEDEIGNIDGFEVKLSRPPDSEPTDPATIQSLVVYKIQKIEIEL